MKRFLRDNGLSLVLFVLFFFTFLFGQSPTGHQHYNNEQQKHGQQTVGYLEYLGTGHFLGSDHGKLGKRVPADVLFRSPDCVSVPERIRGI